MYQIYQLVRHLKGRFIIIGIIPFIAALGDLGYGLLSRWAVDNYAVTGNLDRFWVFLLLCAALLTLQGIVRFTFSGYCWRTEILVGNHLSKTIFNHAQTLPASYFDKQTVGQLLATVFPDAGNLGDQVGLLLWEIPMRIAKILFVVVIMFIFYTPLAGAMLLCVALILTVSYFFQKSVYQHSKEFSRIRGDVMEVMNESISGAFAIKTASAEDWAVKRFEKNADRLRRRVISVGLFSGAVQPLVLSVGAVIMGIILWHGGGQVWAGNMTPGTLVMFIQYAALLVTPAASLSELLVNLQSARASADRVINLLNEPPDKARTPQPTSNFNEKPPEIIFDSVHLKYENGPEALKGISFSVQPGQTAAFAGETGSGKSTVANLICRFYEVQEGAVYIDGKNIQELTWNDLYGSIAYVPQQNTLFTGTIRDNILFPKPDASESFMHEKAEASGAHGFIKALPQGYDTHIGEGGYQLSTGERQLVSITRALMASPRILIFDEATASVDSKTEQLVQRGISGAMRNLTGIIIAHRLSTIKNADIIFVLSNGEIIEQGSHNELMAKDGKYKQLWRQQSVSEAERMLISNL